MKKYLGLIPLFFVLIGCGETVSSQYKTKSDAVADSLFGRGWLPYQIPNSSYDIKVNNDLDSNTSHGEFKFDPNDSKKFKSNFESFSPKEDYQLKLEKKGYIGYKFVSKEYKEQKLFSTSTWLFFIHPEKGHCIYRLNMD